MIKVEKLNPFGKFCVSMGMIPSSYQESLTYEEQLMWFCNFLEKQVIPAVNNNADAIIELQNYVKNYFDNLDVQEEINNKLDEMAESGELTDIIAQYLGLAGVLAYNTVEDMKSAENLVNGSIAKTLGFHSIRDGGSATYKIRQVTNEDVVNEMNLIALTDNSLVAELIEPNPINPLVFGAYADNTHDDHDVLEYCFNLLNNSNKSKYLDLAGKTYLISEPISITENISNSIIKNGTIVASNDFTGDYLLEFPGDFESVTVPGTDIVVLDSVILENIYLQCNEQCSGIKLIGFLKFKFNNLSIMNYTVYGIETTREDAHELIVSNSFLFTSITTAIAIDIHNNDNMFNNIVICGGICGIHLNTSVHCNQFNQIHIYGITTDNGYDKGIILEGSASNNIFTSIYFDGCCLYSKCYYGLQVYDSLFLECKKGIVVFDSDQKLGNIVFDNCDVYYFTTVTDSIYIYTLLNNSQYNVSRNNKSNFIIQGSGAIYDNSNVLAITNKNHFNYFNISNDSTKYEFGGSGAYLLDNPQTGYTTEVLNNVIYTTEENNPGYHWCGFLVNLDKNTNYLITDLLRNNIGNIQIVGADDLIAGTKTIIASGSNSIEYLKFNSGNYNYIFIIYYGKINIAPEILKIY